MIAPKHKKLVLARLNEIAPDTFDEGEFGPWTFTDVSRKEDEWKLSFENSAGDGQIVFTWDGECVDPRGSMDEEWFEQINAAIIDWEAEAVAD